MCSRCGLEKHPPDGCPRRAHRSGPSGRKIHKRRDVWGFDCETNSAGIVLFLSANAERHVDYRYDAAGLTLIDVLEWLIRAGRGKLCAGFYFNYDAGQIVRMLPPLHQMQLAAKGRVTYRQFRIRHVPGKRFSVSGPEGSVTVWDVAGWAQCSFLRLCQDWKLGTDAERTQVSEMKARRGDFDNAGERELVSYTTLECALLADWVERVISLHESCDIKLKAYSGPGSTASAMVRARQWTPPDIPAPVAEVAQVAFFGGRSEISCMGPIPGPVHSYDVNSAYPRAISELPELAGARWFRARQHVPGAWGFYRVRWQQKRGAPWGLFPVRGAQLPDGHRSVSLLYPTEGVGWFHSIEVDSAIRAAPGCVEVMDARFVEPRGAPFAWIQEVATRRLEYKAAGDARAFPLKVGLNSIYGKLAQHTGVAPLQCLTYAAAVTAHTRAQLTALAIRHGHDIVLLATDGILSTAPLPSCELGAGLGQWEYCAYDKAWILQAGVYWAGEKKRTRGIDARGLSLEQVEAVWWKRKTRAVVTLPVRRVISYRQAIAYGKLELSGAWVESTRDVSFSPAPRRRSYRWRGERLLTLPARVADYQLWAALDQAAIDSDPAARYDEAESLPEWYIED